MKFFYRKFLAAFVFLFFAFNAKAVNDTLTIRQTFDLKVGDTLVYRVYEFVDFYSSGFGVVRIYTESRVGFTIISKVISGDTMNLNFRCLSLNVVHEDSSSIENIDSSITLYQGPIKNVYESCSFFGIYGLDSFAVYPVEFSSGFKMDSLKSNTRHFAYFEADETITYIEKIGLFSYEIIGWADGFPGTPGGHGAQLIFYKSDSTTWIDSARYFYTGISEPTTSLSFHLFPNPTNDELTVTTDAEGVYSVSIYDVTGNCVAAPKNFSTNLVHIKVNHLPQGYYYLKLTDEHNNNTTKGFVISR